MVNSNEAMPDAVVIWMYESRDAATALIERASFMRALTRHRGGRLDVTAAKIVYTELVTNVVRHAPGPIRIVLIADGRDVILDVSDCGSRFRYEPRLPADCYSEGGRGLYLVSQVAVAVRLEPRAPMGSRVLATLPWT
jgi:anti-sigma regulatory factor (Ser/Thr protein kinase)